jgi:hypothetical protein
MPMSGEECRHPVSLKMQRLGVTWPEPRWNALADGAIVVGAAAGGGNECPVQVHDARWGLRCEDPGGGNREAVLKGRNGPK